MKIINPVLGSRLLKYPFGQIYQFFGENIPLYLKAINSRGHNGIDIVGKEGTEIILTQGEIVEVKNTPEGYGKHIRLLTPVNEKGDFYELVYGHLKTINVQIGEIVWDGYVGGQMGNTGFIISGNTPYWGNAPAGKGVHLHFGVRECSVKDTGWQTTYSFGKKVFVKNYNNGTHGYIDPMKFLDIPEDMILKVEYIKGLIEALQKKIQWFLR